MDDGWKVLETRTILQDRWLNLRADDCLTPDGVTISPYYVMSYPDWVNIVAITPDDRLLLVRQYRHAAGRFFLEIPGGGLDERDVDSEKAARRELEEETGYIAQNWQLISTLYPNPASHTNRLHTYLATGAERRYQQRLDAGEEGLTVHALPIAEVLDGLQAGLIGQALHVSSILLALRVAGRLR
ncbi:8-oxo-dGTP pyrophosphatase MutT (NUDIX family) [Rhizobium sp. BK275]|uniref:NUDIX hydrolase n=2 Tax=unclassified Rhizobium TaxID=2613769 RepID=UPI00160743E7|nr:NUDIX hydrolase [Rhizobium sp. BK275]MBB3392867.1 8-oxo-dGTP pyrophosphatase MutT (NUDIX family) [Rhizobium sp. BK275]